MRAATVVAAFACAGTIVRELALMLVGKASTWWSGFGAVLAFPLVPVGLLTAMLLMLRVVRPSLPYLGRKNKPERMSLYLASVLVPFLLYYFACLISAGLCQLAFTAVAGGPPVPTLGASGGIYGLLLAFGMYFPRRTVVLIFPPIPMPARVFVIVFGGLELLFGVTGTASGVAHFAHLGGMLGGWLVIQYRRRGCPFTRR